MEAWESAVVPLNRSRAGVESPRGEFNLSGLSEADGKPLFGIGIENFITLVVFGLIFTLGVLGNSLVITVLARSKPGKRRSTTNIFILNLSIADLAYLLFCIPFQSTVYVLPTWVLGAFICKFIHYFFTVSMLVSIFTLSAMSVDRYVAIVHSRRSSALRVSRNALLGVGLIWALSFAMASPVAHHQHLFHRAASNQTFCWEHWPNPRHKKVYVVCTFVFGYLLPLLLISFCYAKVGRSGRRGRVCKRDGGTRWWWASASCGAVCGHVEGRGTVRRTRGRGEFVAQRERAGVIAEGWLGGTCVCVTQTGQDRDCTGGGGGGGGVWPLLGSLCQISLLQSAKKPQCSAAFSVNATVLFSCSAV